MKHLIPIVVLFFLTTTASAQIILGTTGNRPRQKTKMIIRTATTPKRTNAKVDTLPLIPAGTEVQSVYKDGKNNFIKITKLPEKTAAKDKIDLQGADGVAPPLLTVPDTVVETFSDSTRGDFSVTAGIVTFPFKFRPKNGSRDITFEPTFSLSLVAGPNWKLPNTKDSYLRLLFGVGTSSITLNAKNTDPASNITTETNRPAATFSASLIFETNKIQFALSMGTDYNFDNSDDRWRYQGNAWFSAGIGFSIFSVSTPDQ
jgi:hypothetical protein